MSAAAQGNILESPPSSQAAVCSSLLDGVDAIAEAAFSDRADVLQENANTRLQQMESSQAKSTDALVEELRQNQTKIRELEEERVQMRLGVRSLQDRLEAAEKALQLQQGSWQVPGVPPMSIGNVALPPGLSTPPPPPGFGGTELFLHASPPPGLCLGAPPAAAGALAKTHLMAAAAAGYPLVPSFPHLAPPLRKGSGSAAPESPLARPSRAPGSMPPSSPPGLEPAAPAGLLPDSCPLPAAAAPEPDAEASAEVPVGLRSPVPRSRKVQAPLTPQPATPQRARNATPGPGSRAVPGTPPRTPQQMRTPRPSPSFGTPLALRSPMVPASPFVHCEGGGCIFGFTLRVASGVEVGLDIAFNEGENELHVKGIVPGGAIEAWNRQCAGGPAAGKAVAPSDKVVQVNSAIDVQGMLKQFKEQTLLRFTIVRGEPDAAVDLSAVWSGGAHQARVSRTRLSVGSAASPVVGPAASPVAWQDSSLGPDSVAVPPFSLNPGAIEFSP